MGNLRRAVRRFVRDNGGQDIVEYALLAAFVGVTSLAAFNLISANMSASFGTWNTQVQNLWYLPAPGGS